MISPRSVALSVSAGDRFHDARDQRISTSSAHDVGVLEGFDYDACAHCGAQFLLTPPFAREPWLHRVYEAARALHAQLPSPHGPPKHTFKVICGYLQRTQPALTQLSHWRKEVSRVVAAHPAIFTLSPRKDSFTVRPAAEQLCDTIDHNVNENTNVNENDRPQCGMKRSREENESKQNKAKVKLKETRKAEEEMSIDVEFVDDFSEIDIFEDISLSDSVENSDDYSGDEEEKRAYKKPKLKNLNELSLHDGDLLVIEDQWSESDEEFKISAPTKRKGLRKSPARTPLVTPKSTRAQLSTPSLDGSRQMRSSGGVLYSPEPSPMSKKPKAKSQTPDEIATYKPWSVRRRKPILDRFFERFEEYKKKNDENEEESEIEEANDEAEESELDDSLEFDGEPLLIEVVPEWLWYDVEHHPFFIKDHTALKEKTEVRKINDEEDEVKESPPQHKTASVFTQVKMEQKWTDNEGQSSSCVEQTGSHHSSDCSDDFIDVLGDCSSDDGGEGEAFMPIALLDFTQSKKQGRQHNALTSSVDHAQLNLAEVIDQNVFIPTWRDAKQMDTSILTLKLPTPRRRYSLRDSNGADSSSDDEMPDSVYEKLHRRMEIRERMSVKEFLKQRKKEEARLYQEHQ